MLVPAARAARDRCGPRGGGAGSGSKATDLKGEIYAAPVFICGDNAKNKGDFQSCTVQSLANLMNAGLISGATKGSLGACAANGK